VVPVLAMMSEVPLTVSGLLVKTTMLPITVPPALPLKLILSAMIAPLTVPKLPVKVGLEALGEQEQ
jgi:hypothetical protein